MSNVLDITNLCFAYEDEPILLDVTLTVKQAQFVAVVGENGAGKSTLMNLILGKLKPRSGEIFLFGDAQTAHNHYADIAYVSQYSVLGYKHFPTTLEEVVRIHLKHLKKKLCVDKLLKTVCLEAQIHKKLSQLSGGQLQRVGLLLALIKDAKLILLDEPTSGIDKKFSAELYQILRELCDQGKTVIIITHHLSEAQGFIDKVMRLEDGHCYEVEPCEHGGLQRVSSAKAENTNDMPSASNPNGGER